MAEATHGEKIVNSLMQRLPKDEFYCFAEPRIDSATTTSRYPDFMIIWRSKGVLLLEVKDYVEISGGDQRSLQIKQRGAIESKTVKNPALIANDYKNNVRDLLEKRRELFSIYNGEEKLVFPIECAVVLTQQAQSTISWLEKENIFPPHQVFSSDDLYSVEAFIKRLHKIRWTFQLKQLLEEEAINSIKHAIKAVEVRSRPEEDNLAEGIKRGALIAEQEDLIYRPVPQKTAGFTTLVIRGTVGSGKTIVLTKRAELLGALRPDFKILMTAFNLDLSADLRKRVPNRKIEVKPFYEICEVILGDQFPRHSVYREKPGPETIANWLKSQKWLYEDFEIEKDFMALEIARRKEMKLRSAEDYRDDLKHRGERLQPNKFDAVNSAYEWYREEQESLKQGGKAWQDWEDVAPMTLDALNRNHKLKRYYDVIMVDEAQDFALDWFKILKLMLKPGGHLMMVDDPMQSLWRTYDWSERGFTNIEPEFLLVPMRTTRAIADFAQSLFDIVEEMRTSDDEFIYPMQTEHLDIGDKPTLTQYTSREEEIKVVREAIQKEINSGRAPEQIAVLYPNYNSFWGNALKDQKVYCGHFNRIKGLEFECVFILHLDDIFSSVQVNTLIGKRALYRKLFVAMTRARQKLNVSFSSELPIELEALSYYCAYTRTEA